MHCKKRIAPRLCRLVHLSLVSWLAATPLSAIEIRVSPSVTLNQAMDQVREARKAGDKEPATIFLPEGTTVIGSPVVLDSRDSDLTITGKNATLSGAVAVNGWQKHEGNILKADVSKLVPDKFLPKQLLLDGQRQILARYPNFDPKDPLYGGWAFVDEFPASAKTATPTPGQPPGAPEGHKWNRTIYQKPQDLRKWAHPEDVQLNIFALLGWWNFVEPVASVDAATHLLTLQKDCSYEMYPYNRYFVENALEELDSPGEWYYDKRTDILYFWPPYPLKENGTRIPVLESFFHVNSGARNITISGITLTGCNGTAITFEGAEDCSVRGCTITQVGTFLGYGIRVFGGKNVRISHNEISYTGNSGIFMGGGDRKTLTGPGHIAEDNHIHHMGVYNKNAYGVDLNGVNLTVAHNHIHDGPRFGVGMFGNNIVVEYNHLHHLCMETRDGGAIYTGGRDWTGGRGDKWRYNLVHDVMGCGSDKGGIKHPCDTFGLYPDDNSGGIDIIGNIVYRISESPLLLHCARDCVVENNIFALGGGSQFVMAGWLKDQSSWKDGFQAMVKGYEDVMKEPAWKNMRGMKLHPKDAVHPDGSVMSGDIIRHNIMFTDGPGMLYGKLNHVLPEWNTLDRNLAWNPNGPIATGIHTIGPDKGELIVRETFDGAEPETAPKGWGFITMPSPTLRMKAADSMLQVDCALGGDEKNPQGVALKSLDVPINPGASYRVRLRIKSSEPKTSVHFALVSYKDRVGYWQTSATEFTATPKWQDVEITGRMLGKNEPGWQPWMKTFWLSTSTKQPKGQIFLSDVRISEATEMVEWSAWQALGFDTHSIVADPLFVDWKNDDWRLKPESPAFKLGFKAIPVEKIGIRP